VTVNPFVSFCCVPSSPRQNVYERQVECFEQGVKAQLGTPVTRHSFTGSTHENHYD